MVDQVPELEGHFTAFALDVSLFTGKHVTL